MARADDRLVRGFDMVLEEFGNVERIGEERRIQKCGCMRENVNNTQLAAARETAAK